MNLTVSGLTKTAFAAAMALVAAQPAGASWSSKTVVDGLIIGNLGMGQTITNTDLAGNYQGWTGDAALNNDAWGHNGAWINFRLLDPDANPNNAADVTLNIASQIFNPTFLTGFTLYRTNRPWDDEPTNPLIADDFGVSLVVNGAKHRFNQVAQPGEAGNVWMEVPDQKYDANGNPISGTPVGVIETLGYANAGGDYTNSLGFAVMHGAHDLSTDSQVSVSGSVGFGDFDNDPNTDAQAFSELVIRNMAAGYYSVFLSGANDIAKVGSGYVDVSLSAAPASPVPVPGAVWLFGSALIGLTGIARRKPAA